MSGIELDWDLVRVGMAESADRRMRAGCMPKVEDRAILAKVVRLLGMEVADEQPR